MAFKSHRKILLCTAIKKLGTILQIFTLIALLLVFHSPQGTEPFVSTLVVIQLFKKFSSVMDTRGHHHDHKSLLLAPIVSQFNPVYILIGC
jgi:hypothetical protein